MIDWDAVDTVLFDMDGTLLDLYYDNYFWHEYLPRQWGARRGLDPEQAKAELFPRLVERKGTLSWYCLDYWSGELGLDIMALKSGIEHLIRAHPRAEDFVVHVGALGKRRLLVTNAHRSLLDVKLDRTGIGVHFDAIVSAHDLGKPKEDREFWRLLEDGQRFDPVRTLLIDDNLEVLRAASDYGIGHVLAIAQPDSSAPPRRIQEFPAVDSFAALLAVAGART